MKAYHICHHTDMDGITAAAVIYEYLKIKNKRENTKAKYLFYKIDYSMDLRTVLPSNLPVQDEIYFVDYSFSNSDNLNYMFELGNKGNKIVWIDHHKTSHNLVNDPSIQSREIYRNACIDYYINTEYCGAYLAYLYAILSLDPLFSRDVGYIINSHIDKVHNYIEYIPLFIKYVDSWDTWKHNLDKTTEFNHGMKSIKHAPTNLFSMIFKYNSALIENLFSIEDGNHAVVESYMTKFITEAISKGTTIMEYNEIENEEICDYYGYECMIVDHTENKQYNCFVVNKRGDSTMFGDRIYNYDIVISYQFIGDQHKYSLYTAKDINCAALASRLGSVSGLGGGGHKQAAGFQMQDNIFKSNSVLHITNKIFNKNKYDAFITY